MMGFISCYKCDYRASNVDAMALHMNNDHGDNDNNNQPSAGKSFSFRKAPLIVPEKKKEFSFSFKAKKIRQIFSCDQCDFVDEDKSLVLKHFTTEHAAQKNLYKKAPIISSEKPSNDKPEEKIVFRCRECDFECDSDEKLRKHDDETHDLFNLQCNKCDFRTTDPKEMGEHEVEHDEQDEFTLRCQCCHFSSTKKSQLATHEKEQHDILSCENCDFKTSWPSAMISHAKRHNFSCEKCGYKTGKRAHLVEHCESKHGASALRCQKCEFETVKPLEMSRHVAIEHRVKRKSLTLHCKMCEFRAESHQAIKRHEESAHGTNPNKAIAIEERPIMRSQEGKNVDLSAKIQKSVKCVNINRESVKNHADTFMNETFCEGIENFGSSKSEKKRLLSEIVIEKEQVDGSEGRNLSSNTQESVKYVDSNRENYEENVKNYVDTFENEKFYKENNNFGTGKREKNLKLSNKENYKSEEVKHSNTIESLEKDNVDVGQINVAKAVVTCLQCGFISASKEEVTDHIGSHGEDVKKDFENLYTKDDGGNFECAHCDFKSACKSGISHHLRFSHNKVPSISMTSNLLAYKCSKCDYTTLDVKRTERHYNIKHGDRNLYYRHVCPVCKYRTDAKKKLFKHIPKYHPEFDIDHYEHKILPKAETTGFIPDAADSPSLKKETVVSANNNNWPVSKNQVELEKSPVAERIKTLAEEKCEKVRIFSFKKCGRKRKNSSESKNEEVKSKRVKTVVSGETLPQPRISVKECFLCNQFVTILDDGALIKHLKACANISQHKQELKEAKKVLQQEFTPPSVSSGYEAAKVKEKETEEVSSPEFRIPQWTKKELSSGQTFVLKGENAEREVTYEVKGPLGELLYGDNAEENPESWFMPVRKTVDYFPMDCLECFFAIPLEKHEELCGNLLFN